jgi:hypothetical protein
MRMVRSVGVASLAGGIGLDSALFSAFQAAILEPLPWRPVRVTVAGGGYPRRKGRRGHGLAASGDLPVLEPGVSGCADKIET